MPLTPNALQQWIELYKQNMPNIGGGSPMYGAMNTANYLGGALNFAERMAGAGGAGGGQPMPDYFSDKPSGSPLAGNGVGAGPMPPQQGYNRLAQMLGRRY